MLPVELIAKLDNYTYFLTFHCDPYFLFKFNLFTFYCAIGHPQDLIYLYRNLKPSMVIKAWYACAMHTFVTEVLCFCITYIKTFKKGIYCGMNDIKRGI